MSRVVVTSRSFSTGDVDQTARLAAAGLEVVTRGPRHDLEDLREALASAVGWIAGTGPVGPAQLDLAPHLRVLARYGVGHDSVDVAAANARGIVVTNTPGANSDAVADLAVGLALAVVRGIVAGDDGIRAGDWSGFRGREIGTARVGVVGFGQIGRGVARRFAGFGAHVAAHDPYVDPAEVRAAGAEPVKVLADLLGVADIVTLHLPGGTRVIDADAVTAVRTGQVLVNTARADVVDEKVVADALRRGVFRAYAADTLSTERSGEASPLLAPDLASRVVFTPHLGAQTVEAIDRMGSMAVDDVVSVLRGEAPRFPVHASEESS